MKWFTSLTSVKEYLKSIYLAKDRDQQPIAFGKAPPILHGYGFWHWRNRFACYLFTLSLSKQSHHDYEKPVALLKKMVIDSRGLSPSNVIDFTCEARFIGESVCEGMCEETM